MGGLGWVDGWLWKDGEGGVHVSAEVYECVDICTCTCIPFPSLPVMHTPTLLKQIFKQVIPVRDPDKRRHMARELSVLYRTTHQTHHLDAALSPSPSVDATTHVASPRSPLPSIPSPTAAATTAAAAADGGGDANTQTESKEEEGGRRHVVSLYDAFANMGEGTVALMVEYMDGGSLQDVVDGVRSFLWVVWWVGLWGVSIYVCINRPVHPNTCTYTHTGRLPPRRRRGRGRGREGVGGHRPAGLEGPGIFARAAADPPGREAGCVCGE